MSLFKPDKCRSWHQLPVHHRSIKSQADTYGGLPYRHILAAIVSLLILSGCSSQAQVAGNLPYPQQYQLITSAENSVFSTTQSGAYGELDGFIALFSDIKQANLAQLVQQVYATDLHFNDTIKTHTDHIGLAHYLEETAARVASSRVTIHQIIVAGNDYFLRWEMELGFSVLGKKVQAVSIGMTQIQLDSNGKVIFHQDFWDSTEGLYRHIPVLGAMIGYTRDRL